MWWLPLVLVGLACVDAAVLWFYVHHSLPPSRRDESAPPPEG